MNNFEVAIRVRICKFTRQSIEMGSTCLVIYEGPQDQSCYSKEVVFEMIKLDGTRLNGIEAQSKGALVSP